MDPGDLDKLSQLSPGPPAGWRLGVVATGQTNVLDARISALPECDLQALDARYGSLVLDPRYVKFIDHPSARVSLANLNEPDYARIGRIIRSMMDEYADDYHATKADQPGAAEPIDSKAAQAHDWVERR